MPPDFSLPLSANLLAVLIAFLVFLGAFHVAFVYRWKLGKVGWK
jgi:NADH:ubiquinone oxidoreductase subunit 3 (subunit A)